jgi:glycosyltransferase involved in cell wall biosynthesis
MDIAVEFLGWTSREDCVRLVDWSDVVVVPSLWPEPFGLIGIEALRRGVPVAAFAVGGIPEWLEDGKTGALAPGDPPTPNGLAEAVRRCLTSDDIRRTVRERAVANVPDYSIERHLRALVPLLATVAGRHASVQLREAFAR